MLRKPFPKTAFCVVVLLQILALSGMIGKRLYLLHHGETVLLKCRPVDPRSLFSGDYVILRYTVSDFPDNTFKALTRENKRIRRGDMVYVGIRPKKGEKYWEAQMISLDPDSLRKACPVVLRGTYKGGSRNEIRYGVEQYFVPQFEGRRIEREIRNVMVEAAVARSGESAVKRLFINDREVTFY